MLKVAWMMLSRFLGKSFLL